MIQYSREALEEDPALYKLFGATFVIDGNLAYCKGCAAYPLFSHLRSLEEGPS